MPRQQAGKTAGPRQRKPGRLQGKVGLVTGATRGIGLAIASALAAEGCDLAITARSNSDLEIAGTQLSIYGTRVALQACDISRCSEVAGLLEFVQKEFGRVDILVNNAGISHGMAPVEKLAPEEWERVIATNLTGTFLVTRATLPLMQSGGTIVNNISVKAVFAGEAAYCASKHGALALTNTLREELRPKKIRVIGLMAGATNTAIWKQFWPDAPRENMMSPETVANAVLSALLLPVNACVDELVISPVVGQL